MVHWKFPAPVSVPPELQEVVGGHPLLAELLVRRGVCSPEAVRRYLDPAAYKPQPPTALPDLEVARDYLLQAIRAQDPILVWGDFDVDGQTATTILVDTLRALGASVRYHIPVRGPESHGISLPFLAPLLEAGARVLLTCDTGSTAHEAIAYARARGVTVLVTDHHELSETFPPVQALVNPQRLPPGHPQRTLPGSSVAFLLALALAQAAGREEIAWQQLDLVALGLVADVAELRDDARYWLQRGLEALRTTQRPGLQALIAQAGLAMDRLNEESIGFGLGPRLNAAGRLSDANFVVEFLTTRDRTQARIWAAELEGLNARRQHLCDLVEQGAEALLERHPEWLELPALVLAHSAWHPGVVGIVASRLVERYARPVVLLCTPEGEALARGSARSVPGCNITAAIAEQAERLHSYGGHPMAAGLSLPVEAIPDFRHGLARSVARQLGPDLPLPTLTIDALVPLEALSLSLVRELGRLGPFGAGNPPPVFVTQGLSLQSEQVMGRARQHRRLIVADQQQNLAEVVWWNGAGVELPAAPLDLAYTPQINEYRGTQRVQLLFVDARPHTPQAAPLPVPPRPELEVYDYRREPHPQTLLLPWMGTSSMCLWSEASSVKGLRRHELTPAQTLVVWEAPPGPEEWEQALESVSPQQIVLFAQDPELDKPEAFVNRLLGLIKHALRAYAGHISLTHLAAAMAHRPETVRKGLEWFAAQGMLSWSEEAEDRIRLTAGGAAQPEAEGRVLRAQLHALLTETAAYRYYFQRAEPAALLPGREIQLRS